MILEPLKWQHIPLVCLFCLIISGRIIFHTDVDHVSWPVGKARSTTPSSRLNNGDPYSDLLGLFPDKLSKVSSSVVAPWIPSGNDHSSQQKKSTNEL